MLLIVVAPDLTRRHVWRLVAIVKAVYRATPVAVQPSAVATERNEIGQGSLGVIPHAESMVVSSGGVNLQPTNAN